MNDLVDQKFNIRFLQTVEKYPIIYDPKLKGRSYEIKQWIQCADRAWNEIAKELNCDPLPLKKKWKYFRGIATSKVRQEKMGQKAPPYYLHDYIKFLYPFLQTTRRPIAFNKRLTKEDVAANQFGTGHEQNVDGNADTEVMDEIDQDPLYCDSDSDIASANSSGLLTDPEEKRKSVVTSTCAGNADREQLTSIEYARKQFLYSLLPDLNQMTNSQMRHFKYKVLELIDNILKTNET
ncbi:uncharacterized protein LOC101455979 isoform X3 [Ceratitis capitata]|uniref:uncharacterized protein LOC101455979 isoform X3 n=1 Tax=Ceratitis capitata TaxID=7213 RepID=UPI000329AE41|nr:uncharacterized protein LOC101455979 isoform X3 [Ceratitis capitata]